MRWFFALNENSPGFWDYANLVQVAVHTARQYTTLQPVCIYDGEANALTSWLEQAGVHVIRRSTFLGAITIQFSPIARGAYLRLEIPGVCREQGWTDEYVLYSDCDVMFQREVVPLLQTLRPRFLALAPESAQAGTQLNSGVMLMHVPAWENEIAALTQTFREHLAEALAPPYDQALILRHFAGRIDPLPLELNWKSYWPDNAAAAIVHFHGPKPAQKYLLINQRAPADLQSLANADYFHAAHRWDAALIAALEAVPLPAAPDVVRVEPGFEGYDAVTGIGVPEGPFPAILLPVVRWGLAPATVVEFTVPPGRRARFEACFQCPDTNQIVTLWLGETELARVPIRRVSDPHALAVELSVTAGRHCLRLSYAQSYPQNNGDPRALAVLYRALRVVLVD